VTHTPVELSGAERAKVAAESRREEAIEPELVAPVTNMGKHAALHPTMATPSEELLEGFICSCSGFLVDTNVQVVKVNQAILNVIQITCRSMPSQHVLLGGNKQRRLLSNGSQRCNWKSGHG
jgi:hypothetical protein